MSIGQDPRNLIGELADEQTSKRRGMHARRTPLTRRPGEALLWNVWRRNVLVPAALITLLGGASIGGPALYEHLDRPTISLTTDEDERRAEEQRQREIEEEATRLVEKNGKNVPTPGQDASTSVSVSCPSSASVTFTSSGSISVSGAASSRGSGTVTVSGSGTFHATSPGNVNISWSSSGGSCG